MRPEVIPPRNRLLPWIALAALVIAMPIGFLVARLTQADREMRLAQWRLEAERARRLEIEWDCCPRVVRW